MQHIVGLWEVLAATYIMVQASIRVTRNIPTLKYEWLYLTFVFLYQIPLTSWVPPVFDAYGPERSCCWITSKNWSDCSFFCDWSGPTVCPLLHTSVLVHATGHHPAAAIHHNHAQTIPAVGGQVWTWCFGDKEVHKTELKTLAFYPVVVMLVQIILVVMYIYNLVVREYGWVKVAMWYVTCFVY